MRRLVYTNPIGGTVTFQYSPFLITSLTGLDIPTINLQTQKSSFQDGATAIDQLFEPREVVMQGAINAPNDFVNINTYKRTIISALNPKAGPGTLLYTNNNKTYKLNSVVPEGPLYANKEQTNPFQEFQTTFYCHDPYFYDETATSLVLAAPTSVVNSGDVMAPIVLTITGACTNPTITNSTSGYSISYVGSLTAGQTLTINTNYGLKSCKIGTTNVMANISSSSVFWGLLLGTNSITYSTSSGSPTVTLSYYNKYIGA